jgi:hypothetical protein
VDAGAAGRVVKVHAHPRVQSQVLRRGGDKAALIMAGQPPHGRTMFVQALAAKLGIATGQSLAAVCRRHLPRPLT